MQRVTGLEYLVQPDECHWTVSFGGEHCGRFGDRRSALRSAVQDARRVRGEGHEIKVLVQRAAGTFRALPDRLLDPARLVAAEPSAVRLPSDPARKCLTGRVQRRRAQ